MNNNEASVAIINKWVKCFFHIVSCHVTKGPCKQGQKERISKYINKGEDKAVHNETIQRKQNTQLTNKMQGNTSEEKVYKGEKRTRQVGEGKAR